MTNLKHKYWYHKSIRNLGLVLSVPKKILLPFWKLCQRRKFYVLVSALLIIFSTSFIFIFRLLSLQKYNLSKPVLSLITQPDSSTKSALGFDPASQQFSVKEKSQTIQPASSSDANSVHAFSSKPTVINTSYSATLSTDLSKGITLTSSLYGLSFTMVPNLDLAKGKVIDQHIVYPSTKSGVQAIYTVQNKAISEDIVYKKPPGDRAVISYNLRLPSELEAKIIPGGAIGIFAANPNLYNNISFGSEKDKQLVSLARQKAAKDHLVFALPAPLVKDSSLKNNFSNGAHAHFILQGNTILVEVTGLSNLHYPVSIDPNVLIAGTVPSAEYGGNRDNLSIMSFVGVSVSPTVTPAGGGFSNTTFTATDALATARHSFGYAEYDGYVYVLGGCSAGECTGYLNDVQYVSTNNLNSKSGAWASAGSSFTTARYMFSTVAYNGYLYVLGGCSAGSGGSCTTFQNDVQYAPINVDGTIGSWNSTTAFTGAGGRFGLQALAFNNYLYILGGCTAGSTTACTGIQNDVWYAPFKADGTIGSWTSTTSFTTARYFFGAATYNGYAYILGGCTVSSCTGASDVQYAKFNSNGTIGTWNTTTALLAANYRGMSIANNGFLYYMGGCASATCNSVQSVNDYASINSDGTIGPWMVSVFAAASRYGAGWLFDPSTNEAYMIAGCHQNHACASFQSAVTMDKEDQEGANGGALSNTPTTETTGSATVAYNGYLYILGGCTGTSLAACNTPLSTIQYAAMNGDGTLGAWHATTTALPSTLSGLSAIAMNDYMYIFGGWNGSAATTTSEYVHIASSGNITAAWSNTTNAISTGFAEAGAPQAFNNDIYLVAGCTAYASLFCTTMSSATIYTSFDPNTGNSTAAWASTGNALPAARFGEATALYGHTLYAIMGCQAVTGANCTTFKNDIEEATLSSSGGAGAWSKDSIGAPSGPVFGGTAWVGNGELYMSGGCAAMSGGACTSFKSYIVYSPLYIDGTLGTSLQNVNGGDFSRDNFSGVYYNGYAYEAGGYNSGVNEDVSISPINSGGPGTLGTWTANSTFSTTSREGERAVAYNGVMYVAGGYDGTTYRNDIRQATINNDGTLSSWANAAVNLQWGATQFCLLAYNGYLYEIGGQTATSTWSNQIAYAPIGSTGTLGAWTTAASTFTNARANMGCAVYNDNLYIVGGVNNTTYYKDTQYTTLANSTGVPGSWSSTSNLAFNKSGLSLVANDGNMYAIGGYTDNTSKPTNYIESAIINSNGTLGSYAQTQSFNDPSTMQGALAMNGFMYIFGGQCSTTGNPANCPTGSGQYSTSQLAAIENNSAFDVSSFTQTNSLTSARYDFGYAEYNGYLYVFGGNNGSSDLADVQYAGVQAQPNIGHYSRLINTDVDVQDYKLELQGYQVINPGLGDTSGPGGDMVNYVIATNGCPTFPTTTTQVSPGTASIFGQLYALNLTSDQCGNATNLSRYFWISVIMDASVSTQFPYDYNGETSFTDIIVYYHPNTSRRLRGGATFTCQTAVECSGTSMPVQFNNNQQSLDAPPD